MVAMLTIGITSAFAFKGTSNFACSGSLFYLDPVTGYQPVNTVWDCIETQQTCIYYEDEQGNKQPCDEPLGRYTVIAP